MNDARPTHADTSAKHHPTPAAARPEPALKQSILVAEDSEDTRNSLQELLQLALGVHVDTVADGSQALERLLSHPYSLLITDLRMPRLNGMKLIEAIQERKLPVTVIVTTGHGSITDAVQAMRMGAYDFLTKPPDPQHLCLLVQRALQERALRDEVTALREQVHGQHSFRNVLSKSPRMHDIFELIGNISDTATTVLIEGETGTGKEQVARAIHQASASTRPGPFIAINCAALPETLLESELFGHEKGAFTSASAQCKGRFELANKGTLFLDEVGDVPASMQVKLLRVLQDRKFERLGGTETIEIDIRLVAATNRPLDKMVKEGKFREDLYYRLNVVRIELPPLRDRPEDIPLLAEHFAQRYARSGQKGCQITPEAMERLVSYHWPGNIRQLENAIERACVTSRDGVITPEHLPAEVSKSAQSKAPMEIDLSRSLPEQLLELTASFEERYLRKSLKKCRGHVGRCAKISGLSRRSITDKIAHYGIDKSIFKKES
jgi:DNA-binding NtrC family response regulator